MCYCEGAIHIPHPLLIYSGSVQALHGLRDSEWITDNGHRCNSLGHNNYCICGDLKLTYCDAICGLWLA